MKTNATRMLAAAGLLFLCSGRAGRAQETSLKLKQLRCEYKIDPVGIDVAKPRLSWQLESAEKNVMQTAYEVQVSPSEKELARKRCFGKAAK